MSDCEKSLVLACCITMTTTYICKLPIFTSKSDVNIIGKLSQSADLNESQSIIKVFLFYY